MRQKFLSYAEYESAIKSLFEEIATKKRLAEEEKQLKQQEYERKIQLRRKEFDNTQTGLALGGLFLALLVAFFGYLISGIFIAIVSGFLALVLFFSTIFAFFINSQSIKSSVQVNKSNIIFYKSDGSYANKGDKLLKINGSVIKAEKSGFFVISEKNEFNNNEEVAEVEALRKWKDEEI